MPQTSLSEEDPPLTHYVLTRRDASGEQMNPCDFFESSDEKAIARSAEFLGIPELSEEYFGRIGYFTLARKGGERIFPDPSS